MIRKEWVAAQPEEIVRQNLLHRLIHSLEFPSAYLAVEKGLKQMPHLSLTGMTIPRRRADIICFAKGIHPACDLYPLLMIECKSVKITPKVKSQVIGYNHFMKACFVAVANQNEVRTGWFDPEKSMFLLITCLPIHGYYRL